MKWLLHSKRFKKNLKKFIFLYIGVMCAITSVITYSRYITSMNGSDKAVVASFDVTLKDICPELTNVSCNVTEARPTKISDFDYYFEIDTTKLDVATTLYTYVYLYDELNINAATLKEYDVSTGSISNPSGTISYGKIGNYNYLKLTQEIAAGAGSVKKYRFRVDYDIDTEYKANHVYDASNGTPVVRIGYSAIQID